MRQKSTSYLLLPPGDTMACNFICIDINSYESLQQELVELRQVAAIAQLVNEELETRVKERTTKLLETEFRLQQLTENVPGMIYEFRRDPDGTTSFPYISSGCRDVYEIEPEQAQQNPQLLYEIVHPDDLPGLLESTISSSQSLQNWEYEWRITTSSGQLKWLKGYSKPQVQADGSIFWYGFIIDISERQAALHERKQVEEALRQVNEELEAKVEIRTEQLRQSQARLKRLTDNVPGMMYEFHLACDGTTSLPYVSSGCRELLELEPEQLYQDASLAFTCIHPEDFGKMLETTSRSAQTMQNWECEWRITVPSSQQKWLQGFSRPELQSDGSILWYSCAIIE